MKRLFLILSILALLLLTSCTASGSNEKSSIDSEQQIIRPVQDVLFVTIRNSYSDIDNEYHSSASIIDIDGYYHPLPDDFSFTNTDWYQMVITAKQIEPKNRVQESHLENMYKFINEFDALNCTLITYDHIVWDYGTRELYALYTANDGNMRYKLLCRYGETTQCADNEAVRNFVNWMIDNKYFSTVGFKY